MNGGKVCKAFIEPSSVSPPIILIDQKYLKETNQASGC
jgi:hypothetical protein